ncbi:hypothetical protein [Pareuzebyella sediminis]|uniref:hypothetical protein n=1 Tax=Pareuzebyella sediminis TaxID=2607998 RepID=UPI0011EDF77A|nr:hypothetical protein [Pareuzebyella sediminis]
MAPNKFEKYIREQLRNQEIKPSESAWERVSAKLEAQQRSKRKYPVWYGIAAALLGVLLVSVWYFQQDKVPVPVPSVVSKTVENSTGSESRDEKDTPVIDDLVEIKMNTDKVVANGPENEKPVAHDEKEAEIAAIEPVPQVQEKVTVVTQAYEGLSEALINTKVSEIVAQVAMLERNNTTVSEAEIDALLHEAQQQLLKEKIFTKDNSVDPAALLADVEQELDKSFRDQLFDVLKEGYIKVRTAVADRNK